MITKQTFVIISILLVLIVCNKKQSELEFEQSVIYEIFPALIDSLHFDSRNITPPPPKPIFDKKNNIIGIDTTGMAKIFSEYKKRMAELKADSIKLIIAIKDSAYSLEKRRKNELIKHFSNKNLSLNNSSTNTKYKIDINSLTANSKFLFRYYSEFPPGRAIWTKDYDFQFSGIMSFSRIQFDSTKSYGILTSGFTFGLFRGNGGNIFIKKENGKWIIDEIISTEES
jgi:hypothetical protein